MTPLVVPSPAAAGPPPSSPPPDGARRHGARARARRGARPATAPLPPHLRPVVDLAPPLARRDPRLVRQLYPLLARIADGYYRGDVTGVEHLSDGASLVVSTHNGGVTTPDLYCLAVAFWRRFGLETPAYGLIHDFVPRLPLVGRTLTRLGAVEASPENARLVLRSGFPLLVCPGGDVDSLKPFRQRHRIQFGRRRGFIRLALREQVPIIPVVSVGAHEVFCVLNDGRWLAQASGLARHLRIKTVPLSLSFPLGLTVAGLLAVPLPSKVRVQVLPPIELAERPGAADDPRRVERCFEHVRRTMQRALDRLAVARRWPLLG